MGLIHTSNVCFWCQSPHSYIRRVSIYRCACSKCRCWIDSDFTFLFTFFNVDYPHMKKNWMSFSLQGWRLDPRGILSHSHHVNVYSGIHCFEIWLCELDHRLGETGRQHKTLRTYQDSRRFADGIFKAIFLSEEFLFWFKLHWSMF